MTSHKWSEVEDCIWLCSSCKSIILSECKPSVRGKDLVRSYDGVASVAPIRACCDEEKVKRIMES